MSTTLMISWWFIIVMNKLLFYSHKTLQLTGIMNCFGLPGNFQSCLSFDYARKYNILFCQALTSFLLPPNVLLIICDIYENK